MALFNYATKEITLKIVYYGPGLSGKTTNLQHLHAVLNPQTKGKLLSLSTESDRTLFFDFLPIELGKIRDFSIRFQLYTVPGQVRYNATRKVVLKGADGVVFVADSQQAMKDQNIESFENMRENLVSNNIDPDMIPIILQYNKRDLKNILTIGELDRDLNMSAHYEVLEAAAISGTGVEETFRKITKHVLKDISKKHKIEIQPVEMKEEKAVSVKPAREVRAEPEVPNISPDLEEIEIRKPVSSTEPVFFVDTFECADEDLEVVSDQEADAIEVMAEAEPLQAADEPVFINGLGNDNGAEVNLVTAALDPVTEEPVPSVSAAAWAEIARVTHAVEEMPSAKKTPQVDLQPFPIEKIEGLTDELALVSGMTSKIAEAISHLQKTVSDVKGEIISMRNEIAHSKVQPQKEPELKELKEFKELRREQKEISDLLRDVADLLSSIKEKKSWFRL